MKRTAPIALLLFLTACAASTDVIDQRILPCESGQEVEIRAGLADPLAQGEVAGPLQYIIEVANNSHAEVTVKSVRIEPRTQNAGLETVHRDVHQSIPDGEDHLFEIPASEVWVRSSDFGRRVGGRRIEFVVTVTLTDGDSYRCGFVAGV